MHPFSFRHASPTVLAFALALTASAADPAPLTLQQALATALLESPTLRAEAFEPRIAEARRLQATLRPNPELSVDFENALGHGSLSGIKSLETTLQLSQLIELGDTRARRLDAATGELSLAQADYEAKRIDVLAEVARRFVETAADSARLSAARRARVLGEQNVDAVRTRVEAAVAPRTELNKARTALALLRIDEEHAEHELAVCRQSLAAALGQTTPTFGPVQADLLTLPAVPEFTVLAARLDNSPSLARFATEARWREAQLRLAQSLRRAGVRVSGGLRRLEATDEFGLVAGVSVPLPVRDQPQAAVREARERRAQTDASAAARRLEVRATLFAVYQEMSHARTALAELRDEAIPLAEETLALTTTGYRAGRYSLLDLLDAQKALAALQRESIDHAAAFHLHVIEIERLLGAPLADTSAPTTTATVSRVTP